MNKKNGSKPTRSGHEHIPGLDDYELPDHIEIDYRKAKPNPFAGRVKLPSAGRKSSKRQTHDAKSVRRRKPNRTKQKA